MNKTIMLQHAFRICLLLSLLFSFYFFIDVLVFKNQTNAKMFNTWQFPMLLAIYLDTLY